MAPNGDVANYFENSNNSGKLTMWIRSSMVRSALLGTTDHKTLPPLRISLTRYKRLAGHLSPHGDWF